MERLDDDGMGWLLGDAEFAAEVRSERAAAVHVVSVLSPPLGWLLGHLGPDLAAAHLVEGSVAAAEQATLAELGLDVVVREAVLGDALLDGDEAPVAAAPGAVPEAVVDALRASLEVPPEVWERFWRVFPAHELAADAVAHGVHTLMPGPERARLVAVMSRGICGELECEAILAVLEHSVAVGDGDEVVEHLGGHEAALALLWFMDHAHDERMRALLGELGIEV